MSHKDMFNVAVLFFLDHTTRFDADILEMTILFANGFLHQEPIKYFFSAFTESPIILEIDQ